MAARVLVTCCRPLLCKAPHLAACLPCVTDTHCSPPNAAAAQAKQLASVAAKHARRLPDDLDYKVIQTLSMEAREKLAK